MGGGCRVVVRVFFLGGGRIANDLTFDGEGMGASVRAVINWGLGMLLTTSRKP